MTVQEMKYWLNELPDNARIMFKPENSNYAEDITFNGMGKKNIIAFWGADFEAIVLQSAGQAGNIDD